MQGEILVDMSIEAYSEVREMGGREGGRERGKERGRDGGGREREEGRGWGWWEGEGEGEGREKERGREKMGGKEGTNSSISFFPFFPLPLGCFQAVDYAG